jgi:hypothetical protein
MLIAWLYWVGHAASLHRVDEFKGIPQGSLGGQGARGNGVLRDVDVTQVLQLLIQGKHGYVREPGCQGEVYLPPTHLSLLQSMRQFHRMACVPGVFAAVDGTLIQCPSIRVRHGIAEQQTSWYCYKKRTAWLLLAAVDGFGHFMWFKSRVPGSVGDAAAWNGCKLERQLRLCYDLPKIRLHDKSKISVFVLADTAFGLTPSLMKCYENMLGGEAGSQQELLNSAIIRTCRYF